MKAKAKIVQTSPYKSDGERAFSTFGKALMEEHFGLTVLRMDYEPETFNLPGGKYTPDFRMIMSDCGIVFVEIKGSRYQHGYRDARSKLRAAAFLNPMYTWVELRLTISRGIIKKYEIEVI